VREGRLEQLTDDHSLVAELVRSGKLSPEEADSHPQRSVITRALGTDPDVDVDVFSVEARRGDVFLLCSDGLTSMVDDGRILDIVEENREDLERTAKSLIKEANRGGGEDNITVVAFEIADAEPDETTREYHDADETVQLPAAAEPAEEDTLDELERVPAVDTMVVSPEDARKMWERANVDAAPAADQTARRAWRILLLVVLAACIVAAIVIWRIST
jgi:hypothetical protein